MTNRSEKPNARPLLLLIALMFAAYITATIVMIAA